MNEIELIPNQDEAGSLKWTLWSRPGVLRTPGRPLVFFSGETFGEHICRGNLSQFTQKDSVKRTRRSSIPTPPEVLFEGQKLPIRNTGFFLSFRKGHKPVSLTPTAETPTRRLPITMINWGPYLYYYPQMSLQSRAPGAVARRAVTCDIQHDDARL